MFEKVSLLVFLVLLFLILFTGINHARETITLQIAWWGSGSRHEKTLGVIELFEKKHPDVEIQPIYTGWREYWDRMAMYAATSLPMATRNITGLEHYVRQHGQSLFDSSSKNLGFSEDLFADFYEMDLKLTKEGVFAPGMIRLENNTIENDLIVSDEAVMAAYWTNQIVAISEAAGKHLKMISFPHSRNQVQSGYYIKPSMYWTITKNSDHPELAAEFIDFLINDIEANKILNADRGVSISPAVRSEMESLLDETEREMYDFIDFISQNSEIIGSPPPAGYDRVIEILEELHYKILDGSLPPREAYRQLKRRTGSVLKEDEEK